MSHRPTDRSGCSRAAPPAVVVHGLADARSALRSGRPVLLLSAPGAASYAGCGWWRALVERAVAEVEGARETPDLLDCADSPGRAVEALRAGCLGLVLDSAVPAFADVAARAAALGAAVLPVRPPALDLARPGARRQLDAWLAIG